MESTHQFDLNRSIQTWRQTFEVYGMYTLDDLDELESHLLDLIQDKQADGLSIDQAFEASLQQIGTADSLRDMYQESNQANIWRHHLWLGMIGIGLYYAVHWSMTSLYALGAYGLGVWQLPTSWDQWIGISISLSILTGLGFLLAKIVNPSRSVSSMLPNKLIRRPVWIFGLLVLMLSLFLLSGVLLSNSIIASSQRHSAYWEIGMMVIRIGGMIAFPLALWIAVKLQSKIDQTSNLHVRRKESIALLSGTLLGFVCKWGIQILIFIPLTLFHAMGLEFELCFTLVQVGFLLFLISALALSARLYQEPSQILPFISQNILSSSHTTGGIILGVLTFSFGAMFLWTYQLIGVSMGQIGQLYEMRGIAEIAFLLIFTAILSLWSFRRLKNKRLVLT